MKKRTNLLKLLCSMMCSAMLLMSCGAKPADVEQADGESIIRDAQKMVPVPLGDVIVTFAGNIHFQKTL